MIPMAFIKKERFLNQAALKTLTFAVLHFMVGFVVTYAFTGSIAIASGIALVEPAVNTVVFYLHERVWSAKGQLRTHKHVIA